MIAATATSQISSIDAETLLGWVGNNGIDGDVDLYDGGVNDYSGETFFGFTADIAPSAEQVAQALIIAAQIVKGSTSSTFIDYLAASATVEEVAKNVGILDGYSSVQIVVWNAALI